MIRIGLAEANRIARRVKEELCNELNSLNSIWHPSELLVRIAEIECAHWTVQYLEALDIAGKGE